MISGLAFLVAGIGAVGLLINVTGMIPAFSTLPIPQAVWPVMMVGGIIVHLLTRRAAD